MSTTILTNIFNPMAEYIAKMYRAMWNIEIFFQDHKIYSENQAFFDKTKNVGKSLIQFTLTRGQ